MSINILLTGGRAPATYYFARLLKQQGHVLFMAESLPKHLCKHSRLFGNSFLVTAPNENRDAYIGELIDIIKANKIDLLIPTCEEVFHVAYGYEQLSRYCRVFCEPLEKINVFHHKGLFMEMLAGLESDSIKLPYTAVVDTTKACSKIEIANMLEEQLIAPHETYVCKPAYSRFGTQVAYKRGDDMIDFLFAKKDIWVIQEKINGRQICTYAIADQGQMNYYSAYPSDDTVGLGATIYFEPFMNRQLEEFVGEIVRQTSYTGQIAFDLIMTVDGVFYPIECNPRTTSGICLFPLQKHSMNPDSYIVGTDTTMLGLAMLPTLFNKGLLGQISKMMKAKDIIWNPSDKRAFADQITSFLYLWKEAKKRNISNYQMSTIDIEWNGRKGDEQ